MMVITGIGWRQLIQQLKQKQHDEGHAHDDALIPASLLFKNKNLGEIQWMTITYLFG